MKKFILIFILTLSMVAFATIGDSWDLKADFSTTNNPNGPWSYGGLLALRWGIPMGHSP